MEPSSPVPPELAAELEDLTRQRDAGAISEITYNVRRNVLLNQWEVSKRRAAREADGRRTPGAAMAGAEAAVGGGAPPAGYAPPAWQAPPDRSPPNGWTSQPWNPMPVPGVAYGGFWIRACAALVDAIILYVPLAVVLFVLIRYSIRTLSFSGLNDLLTGWTLAYLVIAIAYGIVFISTMGATPGMRMLSLRVVRAEDGASCGLGRAAARGISWMVFGFLSRFLIGLLDPLWVVWDSRKQALHDKIAGTVVIRHWKQSEGLLSPDGQYRWDGSGWQPVYPVR